MTSFKMVTIISRNFANSVNLSMQNSKCRKSFADLIIIFCVKYVPLFSEVVWAAVTISLSI